MSVIETNQQTDEDTMSLHIGDIAPDFTADTTEGTIKFHEWLGDSWGVLFSHPKDFTPVCTTELGYVARIKPEFDKRNVKVIGLSVDPIDSHAKWSQDIAETQGHAPNYPLIGDPERKVADLYDMVHPNASDTATVRSAGAPSRASTGTGLSRPPSASRRPPTTTGVNTLGMPMEARIAVTTEPRWNHTSRRMSRSAATAVNGMARSSMFISPVSSWSFARTLSAPSMPARANLKSSSRNTSRWRSPDVHAT